MMKVLPFNTWMYCEDFKEEYINGDSVGGFTEVTLPHTNKEIPFNYFDEKIYQFISCYKKEFVFNESLAGKRVFIEFGAVANYAEVYLNGKLVGGHKGGYTPFKLEITEYIMQEKTNTFVVKVDSTERNDIPPFGYLIDYLCYGGIYREVELVVTDQLTIERVSSKALEVLSERKKLIASVELDSKAAEKGKTIHASLIKDGIIIDSTSLDIDIPTGKSNFQLAFTDLKNIKLWDIDDPQLYVLEVRVDDSVYTDRIGFRSFEFTPRGFFLNGRKVKLRGLDRHQSYPYVGYAMPERVQAKDADVLKYELDTNIVRTSHYPQSKHFLDRCDEVGLLVMEEIPGWQHIGDQDWQDISCRNVAEMIQRDINHPSIILWGVRINESGNSHDFYERTNKIAHDLDDSRPTGGVKYLENVDFQEDVFVMNDFQTGFKERRHRDQNISTGLSYDVPYLISEFCGIFHPTKRFDPEEHRINHALRHAWGHDEIALDDRICGAIAWCAFDYNTHYEFGPGDRICYHGVMDMFRLPKMAAGVYSSQADPHKKPVLEPATMWTNGDRDNGGFLPLYIFTNCDYVDFCFGGEKTVRLYPSRTLFAGLEHPPIYVEKLNLKWDHWCWEDVEFTGYVDEKKVISKAFAKDPHPAALVAQADDQVLKAHNYDETYDATRVVFTEVDQVGNLLDFMMDPVEFIISGPGRVMGPEKTVIQGGCIAAWIRTTGEKGTIKVKAKTLRFESNEITIEVK
jgi:beta-galactosidase